MTSLTDEETEVKIVKNKKDYLYEYILDDMVKNDEITLEQANQFYSHFVEYKDKSMKR